MTFCGDLPFVPSGIHHHLFENLRRMGHHCHGLKRTCPGQNAKFFTGFWVKSFVGCSFHPGLVSAAGCGCIMLPATGA
ncbi:hypothetical protein AB2J01_25130 (plasmid) [Escherichia coli]